MIPLELDAIAAVVGGRLTASAGAPHRTIDRVVTDTRDPELEGALFVALSTASGDGHAHLGAAARGGAAAAIVAAGAETAQDPRTDGLARIVVDDPWRALRALAVEVRRRVDPTVVAITGSYGKTTTKDLALGAIGSMLRTVAAPGSYNNELGVPRTMLLLQHDSEALVAEVGARHVGDIADMAALLAPDVAVVTAVAGVHLEVFGSIDAVARGKRELVEALAGSGTAVLNADDARVAAMAVVAPATVTYSVSGGADVVARSVRLDDAAHALVVVDGPWGEVELHLPLPGRHHVANALAAITAAGVVGVSMEAAAAGIAAASISPWRCEVTRAAGVTILNDAYNASPDTVRAALGLLADLPAIGRRIVVLGEMAELGEEALEAHRGIGAEVAARGIDELVVVAPPDGVARAILEGALAGGSSADRARSVPDADAAARLVTALVRPGDAVLVKASRVGGLERLVDALRASLKGTLAGTAEP